MIWYVCVFPCNFQLTHYWPNSQSQIWWLTCDVDAAFEYDWQHAQNQAFSWAKGPWQLSTHYQRTWLGGWLWVVLECGDLFLFDWGLDLFLPKKNVWRIPQLQWWYQRKVTRNQTFGCVDPANPWRTGFFPRIEFTNKVWATLSKPCCFYKQLSTGICLRIEVNSRFKSTLDGWTFRFF